MMLVLCVAICLASLIGASTVPPCICTMDYTPVCGVDGKTYGNKCGMDCVGVQLDHQGECGQKPPCICPKIYMPVCGDDGVTYANQCEMTCVGTVTLASTGVCPTTTSATGGIIKRAVASGCICPFIYMPVCGSDGITYGNECNLNCTAKASASPTFRMSKFADISSQA